MFRIKRYANGRFYDTLGKIYTTREQMARRIEAGESLSIVEAKTGRDITHRVFPGAAHKNEAEGVKPAASGADPGETGENVLTWLLKRGEDIINDVKAYWESIRSNLSGEPQDEIDGLLAALKKKRGAAEKEGADVAAEIDRYWTHFYDRLSGAIDRQIEDAIEKLDLVSLDQVRELAGRIEEIKRTIEAMEKETPEKKRRQKR
ncbi:MAG: polyhydroxyalkanoate synthesis regulator DNA-binding domain-containing protein [Desulfosalsimonadaceae bacterium]